MDEQRVTLTQRIGFAEDWLARARRQVEDGEQARGILTLLIAEAEVHRARDLGTGHAETVPVRTGQRQGTFAALAVGAALVAAIALWYPFGPIAWNTASAGEVSPHPIVSLSAGAGSLLRLVQAPETPERTVTVPTVVQVMVRVPTSPPTVERATEPLVRAPAPVRPTTAQPASRRPEVSTAATPPPATVSESSTLLSEVELIDLVLATERSLRRTTNQ